jgi:hypothetical protein
MMKLSAAQIDEYFNGDKLTCLICGKRLKILAAHVARLHGCTAKEYQDEFGLPRRGLVGLATSEKQRSNIKKRHAAGETAIVEAHKLGIKADKKKRYRPLTPARLEANSRQLAKGRQTQSRRAREKTHCPRGHSYTDTKQAEGRSKRCLHCEREREGWKGGVGFAARLNPEAVKVIRHVYKNPRYQRGRLVKCGVGGTGRRWITVLPGGTLAGLFGVNKRHIRKIAKGDRWSRSRCNEKKG